MAWPAPGRASGSAHSGSALVAEAASMREQGRGAQALALLEAGVLREPGNIDVLGAYGKALVEAGNAEQGAAVLARAHTPDNPDWRILSAQGVAADMMGDHARARNLYAAALGIRPDDPGILTNLGLSYALDRQLAQAEQVLRQAAASPRAGIRTRETFALVLALGGDRDRATRAAQRALPLARAADPLRVAAGARAPQDAWALRTN